MDDLELKKYVNNLKSKSDEEKIKCLDSIPNETYQYYIIISLKSEKAKIQCLERLKNEIYKVSIIINLSNQDDKINCIDKLIDEEMIANAASTLKDNETKIKYMNKIRNKNYKSYILRSMQLDEIEKIKYINSIKNEETKSLIISSLENDDFKIKYLDEIKNEKNRAQIIYSLYNDKTKLDYLRNIRNDAARAIIIASLKDNAKKRELLQVKEVKYNKLGLLHDITIGIEIECEGENSVTIKDIEEPLKGWKSKDDTSLQVGVEVVSPILTNTDENIQDIYYICNILKNSGQEISNRCGGHIHIGADALKSVNAYINFLELWCNNEETIYKISNEKGEELQERTIKYSAPISKRIQQMLEYKKINNLENMNLTDFIKEIQSIQRSKDAGLNLLNVNYEKNTIEFRVANGTLKPDTWIENINLFGGMIQVSQKIAEIMEKDIHSITNEEENILNKFNMVRDINLSSEERLNLLLDLTVSDDQKNVYIKRYMINNNKFKENQKINQELLARISKNPVLFRTSDVGNAYMMGKMKVNVKKVDEARNIMNEDIREISEKTNTL